MPIQEGDLALLTLYDKRGRPKKFLVKVKSGKVFHTHKGTVDLNKLIGRNWGTVIETNKGIPVEVHKPSLSDLIEKIGRGTQIIYPKDSGFILVKCGIRPDSKVVEIGTGSGAMTLVLATFLVKNKLVTYDISEKSLRVAKSNLEKLGVKNVEFKLRDAKQGIDERDLDCVIMDVPDPWEFLAVVREALKDGGTFVAFVPSCEQIPKTVLKARELDFGLIEVHEILDRQYEVNEKRTRPMPRMIAHTGFIIIGRKLS